LFGAVFLIIGVVVVFGIASITVTDRAAAASLIQNVASAVSCSATGTASCFSATNTSSGIGVYGTSKSGTGLRGLSTSNNGLKATSTSGIGVNGQSSSNDGVYGQSTSGPAGVFGYMANGNGVYGSTDGNGGGMGVVGASASGSGVYGSSQSSIGVFGITKGSNGSGVSGQAGGGYGVSGFSSGGTAIYGSDSGSGGLAGAFHSSGEGVDIFAETIGLYVGVPGGNTYYPLFLVGGGQSAFYVDGNGDIYYRGNANSVARTRDGLSATAYNTKTTAPTLEDTGTAQLIGGVSTVRLDPLCARTIDASTPYRIFLTPAGDSRGLYVASRSTAGFVIRESQGGRSSLSFDYRIVAAPIGRSREHMALVDRDAPRVVPHVQNAPTLRRALVPPQPRPQP